jgi:hypothetical protein
MTKTILFLTWTGRVLNGLLFLLWGAFFLEHLGWFSNPAQWPPAHVFLLQMAHLALLLGLLATFRWDLAGSLAVILSALAFFPFAAGRKAPLFIFGTVAPSLLLLLRHFLRNQARIKGATL